jgi:hypothetical protein
LNLRVLVFNVTTNAFYVVFSEILGFLSVVLEKPEVGGGEYLHVEVGWVAEKREGNTETSEVLRRLHSRALVDYVSVAHQNKSVKVRVRL